MDRERAWEFGVQELREYKSWEKEEVGEKLAHFYTLDSDRCRFPPSQVATFSCGKPQPWRLTTISQSKI
jgi:hypothetical protein